MQMNSADPMTAMNFSTCKGTFFNVTSVFFGGVPALETLDNVSDKLHTGN